MAQTISSNNSFKSSTSISKADIQDKDVLCGRCTMSHSHVGNKHFRCIIKQNRDAYRKASSNKAKTRLSNQIVAMIRSSGGRYLKYKVNTGEWEPQDDKVARDKVAHALRSCKDPNQAKVKRTRVVKEHVPTQQENLLFEQALQYQRKKFKEFMAQATDSKNSKSGSEPSSPSSSLYLRKKSIN